MSAGWLPRGEWLKTLEARPASAAVLIENLNGELLIVKANYKTHWSLPGGVIDAGESPVDAAVREVKEEVDLDLRKDQLQLVAIASRKSTECMTYQFVFYTTEDCGAADIRLQESELDELKFISRDDVANFSQPLLWVIEQWAKGESGYFETNIVETGGTQMESVCFHVPFMKCLKEGRWEN